MKKKSLLAILILLVAILAVSFTACKKGAETVEFLSNDCGVVVRGGGFTEGSTLITREVKADAEEASSALAAISDKSYNKEGNVYIYDIYVTKDDEKVQPNENVTVSIPDPGFGASGCIVFHVKSDGAVEEIVPTVSDGTITFETSSFSYFILAEKAACIHSLDRWIITEEATCIKEGVQSRKCMLCGELVISKNYLADHEYGTLISEVSPTLFESGAIAHYECSVCGKLFDSDKVEVSSVATSRLEPNISICLDGVAVGVFTVDSATDSQISLSIADLEVTEGQTVSCCSTDNPDTVYEYTVIEKQLSSLGTIVGNIDPTSHKVRTTSVSSLSLTIEKSGTAKLSMDGYVHSGMVVELTSSRSSNVPVLFPLTLVDYYDDPEAKAYVFGLFGSDRTTSLRIIDMDTDTVYDYDDLSDTNAWDKWSYSRGADGKIVFAEEIASDWWLAFDIGGDGKITLTRHNHHNSLAPTINVFDGETVEMEKITLEVGSDEYKYYTWPLTDEAFSRQDEWLDHIDLENLTIYRGILRAEAGDSFYVGDDYSIKPWTLLSMVYVEGNAIDKHTTTIKDGYYTKAAYGITLENAGTYVIEYLPFCNVINIIEIEDFSDGYVMYLDGDFIDLEEADGCLTYELEADEYTNIAFLRGDFSFLPVSISADTPSGIANVIDSEGTTMLFFTRAGKYTLSYNISDGVVTITPKDGDIEDTTTYFYWLATEDDEILMEQDAANENLYVASGVTMNSNSFLMVGVYDNRGNETICTALFETDASVAESDDEKVTVYLAGTYDVYFDITAQTIKLVRTGDLPESSDAAVPKDIYIRYDNILTLSENPDNPDELCYLGFEMGAFEPFHFRDTDRNDITDITLAEGTTNVGTNGRELSLQVDGIFDIYINKTTHEVRIVSASGGADTASEKYIIYQSGSFIDVYADGNIVKYNGLVASAGDYLTIKNGDYENIPVTFDPSVDTSLAKLNASYNSFSFVWNCKADLTYNVETGVLSLDIYDVSYADALVYLMYSGTYEEAYSDEHGIVTKRFEFTESDNIYIDNSAFEPLPMILHEDSDSSLVTVMAFGEGSMLYIPNPGIYDLTYDLNSNIFTFEAVIEAEPEP